MNQRRGGLIQVQVNGEIYDAKGTWSYNIGRPKREAIIGADGVHGFTEKPQVSYIEGEFTDRGDLDLDFLVTLTDATITLSLANGKMIVLRDAWYSGEGKASAEEANIEVRFEGASAEEIPA